MRNLLSSFVELVHLQSEMNKLFEALHHLHGGEVAPEGSFSLPYDVVETPEEIMVQVDLPGADPESIDVTVRGGVITMKGEREKNRAKGILAYHLMERDRGHFLRQLTVEGPINTHKGQVLYERGVLTIRFPRVQDERGRTVALPLQVRR